MQFSTLPMLALFAIGALAAPSPAPVQASLEARVDCSVILPACFGGSVVGQTNCRCSGQKETCDLWSCPGEFNNVVSAGVKKNKQ